MIKHTKLFLESEEHLAAYSYSKEMVLLPLLSCCWVSLLLSPRKRNTKRKDVHFNAS